MYEFENANNISKQIKRKTTTKLGEFTVKKVNRKNLEQKLKKYHTYTGQKMKFFIKAFFSKCNQISSFFRIWSHLLNKSLIKTSVFVQCQILSKSQSRKYVIQKQPSRGVSRKTCSENMQQIYRRTSMPKCDFKTTLLKSHFGMDVLL